MSVVNAASVQSAANAVAVMRAAVVVVVAVNAPKAVLSGRVNAVLSEAKAALIHAVNAAQKAAPRVVQNVLQPKAVQKVAAKVVAVRNAPVKRVQTCALKVAMKVAQRASLAAKVNRAAKAVVTAPAVNVLNAQSALTVVSVALNATAHPATPPKKNWPSPIRLLWQPLRAAM
jgi:hypothetical protein